MLSNRTKPGTSWGLRSAGHHLRQLSLIIGVLLAAGLATAAPASAGGRGQETRVIVRLEPSAATTAVAVLDRVDGELVANLPALASFVATVDTDDIAALRAAPGVLEVTEDARLQAAPSAPVEADDGDTAGFVEEDFAVDDGGPTFDALTLERLSTVVGADRAWDVSTGAGIDVALLDSGVVPVDGIGAVVNGPDLSFESQSDELRYLDSYGHGTHLAGIINGEGGVAPGSRLVNLKLASADGAVDVSQVIAAIDWVVQHRNDDGLNIRVLTLAYGTDSAQPYAIDPLTYAVEVAWRHGIVVVSSAGNRGAAALDNPAKDPFVIAVGASEVNGTYSTADDTVAGFSSRGDDTRGVDVVAPGRSVVSLRAPGSFIDTQHPEGRTNEGGFRGSGTSQATAVVAGVAALVLEERPELTPDQVKAILTTSARPLPNAAARDQGAGVVDATRALETPTPSAAASAQPFEPGTGTGSLEGARGSHHVAMDGVDLAGEVDILGQPWNGTSWSGTSWSGTSWSGGVWNGTSWSGTSWSGTSWSGTSWSGTSWSGTSWSGTSWSGTSWSGTSWSGTSWSGTSWSGTSWSGTSWSGTSWSGTSWSSAAWAA